jgi:glutathione-specific gamma-glutamylcyclotransferase
MSDFWVFGYGSLMWRPGFEFAELAAARLNGFHRALCVYSWVHRGTREEPGLVLGLDRGGACRGTAYRIEGNRRDEVLTYLRERELVTKVYHEATVPVHLLAGGGRVMATTFLVDRAHEQYAGALPPEELLAIVRRGHGRSGANTDYVLNTAEHLRSVGIRDPTLEWLAERLRDDSPAMPSA